MKKPYPAVVVLSGGQDSVTCLGYALDTYSEVYPIGFSYGQKHSIELEQAEEICKKFGLDFACFEIPALKELGDSALTTGGDVNEKHHRDSTLPASFVPNRNALFLTIAHAYAQKVQAIDVITGVCQTDYSGYPDCREAFVKQLELTLNVGYNTGINLVTPLMYLTKAQTFELAEKHGFLKVVVEDSHTCYNGDRTQMNEWGAGCGQCPACKLRAAGWEEFVANRHSA